jgi:hypothetical protein
MLQVPPERLFKLRLTLDDDLIDLWLSFGLQTIEEDLDVVFLTRLLFFVGVFHFLIVLTPCGKGGRQSGLA